MDLQSALVCGLVFVISAVILLLISMFGIKEKSYEEALAEQKKLTSGLLGQKPKPKEKKQKKAGKKVKEKIVNVETEVVEEVDSETVAPAVDTQEEHAYSKLHVEFEPDPAVIEQPQTANKKRTKKEKIRSILHNKEKSPVADAVCVLPINHFEKIHPKDEFELLHAHQKEEVVHKEPEVKTKKSKKAEKAEKIVEKVEKVEPEPEKVEKHEKPSKVENQKSKKKEKSQPQPPVVEEVPVAEIPKPEPKPEPVVKKETAVVQTNVSAKEKKKKKSEFNTLQQMTSGDKAGVNVSLLVPLVRKADLTRSEIQILIDLLLNKQHEAPNVIDEWSEGRADPVQKLKKQLAEKEKALTAEQEALIGHQAKLREVRAELNSERSRLLQTCRNLEENLHSKQTEFQAMVARNHTLNQKLQQMQAQLNEEMMTSRKLREELNSLQMQRKQLELHIASVSDQQQEADATFQSQLNQARVELQEQQNLNAQLNMELHSLRDKNHTEKEMLQERIRHTENQAHHFKAELEQKQDIVRQLEESRRKCSEMEHKFSITHQHENDLKMRCQQHLDEARRLEKAQSQTHDDLSRLHSEVNRLTATNKQQQEDNDTLISQLRTEITHLKNEKTKLEAANGEATANKVKEVEILNLQNEISSLRAQLQENDSVINVELEKTKKSMKEIEAELQEQRNKNDELRKRNWKVMEALNNAESSLRSKPKPVCDINEMKKQIKSEELESYRQFLQRLFPDVKIPNSEEWMPSAEKLIKNHVSSLKPTVVPSKDSTEVSKLQAELAQYKTIIVDTENMLNNLQKHVEVEEKNWRQTLTEKENEIDLLKEQNKTTQLQAVIEDLEGRLMSEQQVRQNLESECLALKSRVAPVTLTDSKHTQFGNLAEKEKLSEENSRITDELTKERQRSSDLSAEILRLQSQTTEAVHSKSQNHTSNGTTEIIDSEFSNSATSSTISTSSTKSQNKKNKKKKNTSTN